MPADLRTRIGHLDLPSPIITASGCAGTGRELAQFTDVARIGAIITKSVTLEPKAGNPSPRMTETPSGLLSSVGLQGPGLDGFLQRDLPWLLSRGARAIVSVAGHHAREYGEIATRLSDAAGVTALEVNLGCPDAATAGRPFAHDPAAAGAVVAAVRGSARYDIPVFAKLSPDVTDIVAVARACVSAGADGLSMINTVPGMTIDPVTFRPALAGLAGGLSRAGRPAGRRALRVAGPRGAARRPAHRLRRRADRAATPWSCCSRAPPWWPSAPCSSTTRRPAPASSASWRRS